MGAVVSITFVYPHPVGIMLNAIAARLELKMSCRRINIWAMKLNITHLARMD